MAHHFTNADWHRRIALATGIKGRTGTPVLEGSVQPVAIVDDLQRSPDLAQGIRSFATFGVATGNAGNMGIVDFFNPSTSGVLVRVERVTISLGNTATVAARYDPNFVGVPPNFGTCISGAIINSLVGINTRVFNVFTGTIWQHALLANTIHEWKPYNMVLGLGSGISIAQTAVGINNTFVSVEWTEFPVAPRG